MIDVTALVPAIGNGQFRLIPKEAPHVEAATPDIVLGAFLAAIGPAAVLGALAGSHLATLTPKQNRYAKLGALAGIAVAGLALSAITLRQRQVAAA